MDAVEAIEKLLEPADVAIESSDQLVGKVERKAAKLARERRDNGQEVDETKPRLAPVPEREHDGNMNIMPWELLHLLGRATVLSGHGSSRALAQHWGCLKYITSLQRNAHDRMELSDSGKDPRYHRRSVQAEDLGIAFALAAALRIAQRRHPGYRFELVDADVALEAGWALRGNEVKAKPKTRLRPDYFLFGFRHGSPARVITVECKGSHGSADAQHKQLAKAAAQVNAVVIGDPDHGDVSPPGLMMSTSLDDTGGIQMRILDPPGDGTLALSGDVEDHTSGLNGPVEQLHEFPGIPVRVEEVERDRRPGFYIAPDRSEWFARVLARTASAGLLAFAGDRNTAGRLLTPRQRIRLGVEQDSGPGHVAFDTGIDLAGLRLVGTDHVFRLSSERMEVFSGIPEVLHELLRSERPDLRGRQHALPDLREQWRERQEDIERQWGGVVFMDINGAVMGLRKMGEGRARLD
ncbi:hypothetical protein [Kutzneria sp. CA-103260]|uniref:hypothetical protein n=1 Tax=Kutzneria sp. CA-103260 TaxID=2802641 RepID=UPI001BABFDD3|nr:hypothetical protein [Kutzneria sp. CA-103260]QUQ64562.1 hypothetical protein JJ691_22820 [Kutzneria sp. CA-103260]